MIYLDHSATSPLLPKVRERMEEVMSDVTGNPSALHTPGHISANRIAEAREHIARVINADPKEIIFTSCGSESNNAIIKTFAGYPIAASNIEHPSILQPARDDNNLQLISVDKIGVVGEIPDLSSETRLISIMIANNEIGSVNNIKELAIMSKRKYPKVRFHTDATQAFGRIKLDVDDLGVDYMTISGHKIGGPVGVSAVYIRKGAPFKPLIMGGHQERGLRAGTYPVANIVGFGEAARLIVEQDFPRKFIEEVKPLRDYFAQQIIRKVPHSSINHSLDNSLPNILNVSFAAAEGESIQLYLDARHDIIVSTGSACASGDGKPSHVLMALYNDAEVAHSSIRFSLGLNNTREEIDYVVEKLVPIIDQLQQISTVKIGRR